MVVCKNNGILPPKMDGENNGSNPMNKFMIWGVNTPIFGNTQVNIQFPWICHGSYGVGKTVDLLEKFQHQKPNMKMISRHQNHYEDELTGFSETTTGFSSRQCVEQLRQFPGSPTNLESPRPRHGGFFWVVATIF